MIQLISFDRDKAIAAGMTITSVRRPPSPSPEHPPETIVRIPHTPFVAEDRGTPDRIMIRPSTSLGVFFLKVWLRTNMIPHESLPTAAERQRLATVAEDEEVADSQQQEAEPPAHESLARQFHEAYERLAPNFGYETREDTKQFDPLSNNGRLMMAVCAEIITAGQQEAQPQVPDGIVEKYNELLYHVSIKFTNETRHETALRYIKNAEAAGAKCAEAKEEKE